MQRLYCLYAKSHEKKTQYIKASAVKTELVKKINPKPNVKVKSTAVKPNAASDPNAFSEAAYECYIYHFTPTRSWQESFILV